MIMLRDLDAKDKTYLVKYLNNANVVRYLSSKIPRPYTLEDAIWWIESGSKKDVIVRAIEYNKQFVGVVGAYLQDAEYAHSAELGYWVAEEFWNKNIATESVIQFVQLVFSQGEIIRLFNRVSKPNTSSIRVMEKSGFQLEGESENSVFQCGEYLNELNFSICNES